ncbi:MAG: glycoside hydrolase family 16 protein [Mycobacterium sp.]
MSVFRDRFEQLDPAVWTTAYLPAWSSRAQASATFSTGEDGLDLSIPHDHPLWCPDLHATPLRVSGIQSANRSGAVGTSDAPQPFRDGLLVREQQPTVLGFVPQYGHLEVTCSAELTVSSMFSAWLVGLEDQPHRCGEICLMEVFGNTVDGGRAAIGQGIHPFRDPALREDFSAPVRNIDITQPHTYGVHWQPGVVDFTIDGVSTRTSDQAPDYPMLLFLAVFDFPEQSDGAGVMPHLRVSEVSGKSLGPGTVMRGG